MVYTESGPTLDDRLDEEFEVGCSVGFGRLGTWQPVVVWGLGCDTNSVRWDHCMTRKLREDLGPDLLANSHGFLPLCPHPRPVHDSAPEPVSPDQRDPTLVKGRLGTAVGRRYIGSTLH